MHRSSVVNVVQVVLCASAAALAGCGSGHASTTTKLQHVARISVSTTAFAAGAAIPTRYTCDGADVSPPLAIAGVPTTARELALAVVDPDAPGGNYTHWLVFAIPPATTAIAEGQTPTDARQALNSLGTTSYSGPCPPPGDAPHHYVFTVYALKKEITLPDGSPAASVRTAIGKEVIATGTLVGRYARTG